MNITRRERQSFALLVCGALALLLACSASTVAPSTSTEGGADQVPVGSNEAGAAPQSAPTWCAARAVLQAKCQRCHAAPPKNGAPFPLLTYADTQAVDRSGTPRFEKMKAALEADYMPPPFLKLTPAVEPLTPSEKSTLLDWLSQQPPLDTTACE